MKLLQYLDITGAKRAGRIADDRVLAFRSMPDLLELIEAAESAGKGLAQIAAKAETQQGPEWALLRAAGPRDLPRLTLPLSAPEIWGAGVTYRRSVEFREGDIKSPTGIYDAVYKSERPELFYKGNHRHAAGHGEPISIRCDSTFTAPEPELALVIDSRGGILAYTLCNDVSAWDIERANPLYVPQSKVFYGCTGLGPVIVTPDELPDPYAGDLSAQIMRDGQTLFQGSVSLGMIRRKFEDLVAYLRRNNPVATGTVLTTGTGIIVTEDCALHDGDVVEIVHPVIGTLSNPVRKLSPDE